MGESVLSWNVLMPVRASGLICQSCVGVKDLNWRRFSAARSVAVRLAGSSPVEVAVVGVEGVGVDAGVG